MQARQLQRQDEDLEEAALYLRRSREQGKEEFDPRRRLQSKDSNTGDLVLLHNTKLEYQFSHKLDFRWIGPYQITGLVRDKKTYFIEKLDGARLQETYTGNRLKFFHLRDPSTTAATPNPTAATMSSQGATTNEGRGDLQLHVPHIWSIAVIIPLRQHDEIETVEISE